MQIRATALPLLITFILALTACGSQTPSPDPAPPPKETSDLSPPLPGGLADELGSRANDVLGIRCSTPRDVPTGPRGAKALARPPEGRCRVRVDGRKPAIYLKFDGSWQRVSADVML